MSERDDYREVDPADALDDDAGVVAGRSVFGDDLPEPAWADDEPAWADSAAGGAGGAGGAGARTAAEPRLQEADPEELGVWTDHTAAPQWDEGAGTLPPVEPDEPVGTVIGDEDFFGYDDAGIYGGTGATGSTPTVQAERDMPMAVLVGAALSALILVAMQIGPWAALAMATVVLGLAAIELLSAVRIAGYQPAVALGLAGVVTMPLAAYWRGMDAIVVVMVLSVLFGALWYLTGVGADRPTSGLASTIFTVAYIGGLGAHAALILRVPEKGTGLLTAAIVLTVAHDVSAMLIGRAAGRTELSKASPNKTLEGLVGGVVVTLALGVVLGLVGMPSPVAADPGGFWTALLLAAVVAVVAPIGDLAESMLKRDLNIKDMGTVLPGHGGVLDRFDALLFVLPATYYVALMTDLI